MTVSLLGSALLIKFLKFPLDQKGADNRKLCWFM